MGQPGTADSAPAAPNRCRVRDVTLREFGQNVPRAALPAFPASDRLWLAEQLVDAGVTSFEVASTASPRVAPAMADDQLQGFLHELGRPRGVELITLVPGAGGYRRFLQLGLGPDGLGHSMGVFLSAMDEHNLANLGRTVDESMAELRKFLPDAAERGIPVLGYVSAAFGFLPDRSTNPVHVSPGTVARLAAELADLGATNVTLSDLQGLAGPAESADLLGEVIAGPNPCPVPVGYHPHHLSPTAVLDNVAAAAEAGVLLFDASLGAVGGCVTGAPGNAPTEGVVARLEEIGCSTGLDGPRLAELAVAAEARIYRPVRLAAKPT